MTLVCGDCGSFFITSDGEGDDDWHSLLVTLSSEVPPYDHCNEWLKSRGISEENAEQTALSMVASIRWDEKKQVWKRNNSTYTNLWRVFQSWCLNDLRRNGSQVGTSMKVRPNF